MRHCYPILFLLGINFCFSQTLKPFIGQANPPQLSDTICLIKNYLGSFEQSGYQLGDTVNDFTLYDKQNMPMRLSEKLKAGKPVLLISSSYTCPIFRGKIGVINQLNALYKNELEIFIIYTVEAHPDQDISPYFGKVNTGATNIKEGILYRQPLLYEDRILIVEDMLQSLNIEVPVLLDGPCNEWWNHFGPAPNNATLIDANGIVQIKHAWFDRDPDDILCDLKNYFNPGIPCDSIPKGIGQFSFSMISDTLVYGEPNSALYVVGQLQNNSTSTIKIEVRRLINNMPPEWSSSMCLDVCYPTTVDSTQISLKPNQKMDLIVDYFTGPTPAEGSVRIGMRNVDDTRNKFTMRTKAVTQVTGTSDQELHPTIKMYPNPVSSFLTIETDSYKKYELLSLNGNCLLKGDLEPISQVELLHTAAGIYLLKLIPDQGLPYFRKIAVSFH